MPRRLIRIAFEVVAIPVASQGSAGTLPVTFPVKSRPCHRHFPVDGSHGIRRRDGRIDARHFFRSEWFVDVRRGGLIGEPDQVAGGGDELRGKAAQIANAGQNVTQSRRFFIACHQEEDIARGI